MTEKVPEKTADKTKPKRPDKPKHDLFSFNTEGDNLNVTQHSDDALQRIYGSESEAVNEGLFMQGYMTLKTEEVQPGTKDMRGFLPAIVRDIAPRDGIERMLAVQMATTHVAMIRQGGRMANAEQLPQFEAHERAYNKLARTYAVQVEALRKHRSGGKQTVTVQHVSVSDGGQAIVGNVETGGRGRATDER
ncbi:hypothetical protein [Tropicimonas sp. IMCC6043]|uniref:hypothetical protein n=1 Tax=Tropicimonas sp. IMCC6043 TaxID=2510645 RepID=UPI00101C7367|nr:hypothetical protein [Tropicimonas sp. IMCC6043]RYH06528.1 hypothetical protein EU800_23615 [Tropicimonas sp. IMCC6043]